MRLTPQTNNTWRKLRLSAFQQYYLSQAGSRQLNSLPTIYFYFFVKESREEIRNTHTIDPPKFLMLRRQISIENNSPRGVTVCFPLISIFITSLAENSNPKYLTVMINPFSLSPHQRCPSLRVCIGKFREFPDT